MTAVCERCGSPAVGRLPTCPRCLLDADIGPRVVADQYELEDEVGHGGMSTVYRAHDLRDGSVVAVKLLREELTEQPGFLDRFRREARVLALLRHPGVVRLHDFGVEESGAFIVMEYVDGLSLAGQLPVAPRRAREIAVAVCAAVAAAHRRGLVHRDLKPENILVDRSGAVKVSDFGIAAFVRDDGVSPRLTAARQAIGTPAYMAPEAQRGAAPDPRMDVYSLGVLFYELVEGHPPQGYFEPPAPFARVLKRALAADPAQRYADAGEMLKDLEPERAAESGVSTASFPDRAAGPAVAATIAAGVATLLRGGIARIVGPGGRAGVPGDHLWLAALVLALALLCAQRLLRRWRRLRLVRTMDSGLWQTTAGLWLAGAAFVLALVPLIGIGSPASAPLLAVSLQAAQLGALAAGVSGLIESRRAESHLEEPWLWLGIFIAVLSFAVALVGALL